MARERWGTRIGLILAAAGNAIGIGNLLRFPSQAAQNGGGAFMIPYVISLLVFGLPMMWIAWAIGRYGGQYGHSSLPGMFDRMWPKPISKYLGVVGVALPLAFCLYYTYIEAWCLAYAYFSATGKYVSKPGYNVDLSVFYSEFLGEATSHSYFPGLQTALFFLVITLLLNIWVLARGISRGIEMLAKIAIPLLFLFCIFLSIRVITVGTIQGNFLDGLNFLWTPDFSKLSNPKVWIAAMGQIFFTLSIGFGALECYASYLRKKEDVALAGLSTAATNEFVEIVFGSMIAIPAAAIFFGPDRIVEIASKGAFAIGMISMPEILRSLPYVQFFGTIWFLLLFFAAFTSSVAVCQPVMAFLQDELNLRRGSAAAIVGLIWFLGTIPVIYFFRYGFLDELDYWAGTIGLVVVAIIEIVIFAWIFGIDKGWEEITRGAAIRVPLFFKWIMKYVTPILLIVFFAYWIQDTIVNNRLQPQPRLIWNVADIASFEGTFERDVRPEGSLSEMREKLSETKNPEERKLLERMILIADHEEQLKDVVRKTGRDLSVWLDLHVGADGSIEVIRMSEDPALKDVLTREFVEEWFEAMGFKYVRQVDGQTVPDEADITISMNILNRAPFIWLARFMMFLFFVIFAALVKIAWEHRKEIQTTEEVVV